MALSRRYTAQSVWVEIVRDLDASTVADMPHWEKYRIINRALMAVVGQFYDLLSTSYMTSATLTLSGDTASISSLNVMRVGQNIKLVLTVGNAPYVEPLSLERFTTWRSGAAQNRAKVVWTLTGDTIQLKKPSGLSYGTTTLWYPKVPTPVAADTDYLDIADGTPIELVILKGEEILIKRLGLPEQNKEGELQTYITQLYKTFGMEVQAENNPEKVLATK